MNQKSLRSVIASPSSGGVRPLPETLLRAMSAPRECGEDILYIVPSLQTVRLPARGAVEGRAHLRGPRLADADLGRGPGQGGRRDAASDGQIVEGIEGHDEPRQCVPQPGRDEVTAPTWERRRAGSGLEGL